ncbi:Zn-dependent protease [Actinobacteria bacterium IMCC26256]|nr:Zn-dependent protease [Actinobacteria bacterium IMCC26256]
MPMLLPASPLQNGDRLTFGGVDLSLVVRVAHYRKVPNNRFNSEHQPNFPVTERLRRVLQAGCILRRRISVKHFGLFSSEGIAANAASLIIVALVVDVTLLPRVFWWWYAADPWVYRFAIALAALIGMTAIIVLHEVSHALFVAWRGAKVVIRISAGFGYVETEGDFSSAAIMAGPFANLCFGFMLIGVVRADWLSFLPLLGVVLVKWLAVMSILLGFGNLLPLPPLDGYRLLQRAIGNVPIGLVSTRSLVVSAVSLAVAVALFIIALGGPVVISLESMLFVVLALIELGPLVVSCWKLRAGKASRTSDLLRSRHESDPIRRN